VRGNPQPPAVTPGVVAADELALLDPAQVTMGGYNIQNIAAAAQPAAPEAEYRYWYQWYFHTERGRAGLAANRAPLCRLLWEL
jgi:hypothetical protein